MSKAKVEFGKFSQASHFGPSYIVHREVTVIINHLHASSFLLCALIVAPVIELRKMLMLAFSPTI